jgi:hypothetical protein
LAWTEIKHYVRDKAGHRCVRCLHPYRSGMHGNGQWSRCDALCTHGPPWRCPDMERMGDLFRPTGDLIDGDPTLVIEAEWRILTVHHLDGDKCNCRWWNLVPLCQRCHLSVQSRIVMDRSFDRPHTTWFQPYVAGFYAWKYLGEDLPRADVEQRLEELLMLELRQERLFT